MDDLKAKLESALTENVTVTETALLELEQIAECSYVVEMGNLMVRRAVGEDLARHLDYTGHEITGFEAPDRVVLDVTMAVAEGEEADLAAKLR